MKEKKTAEYWFRYYLAGDELRQKAMRNAEREGNLHTLYNDVYEALSDAFDWNNTPEGKEWWINTYNYL